MRNYQQPGRVLDHVPVADLTSGQVVALGILLGIACADIAAGEKGSVQVEGVFEVPKVNADTFVANQVVTWDVSLAKFTEAAAAAGDVLGAAIVLEAAGAGTDTCIVRLLPGAGAIQA